MFVFPLSHFVFAANMQSDTDEVDADDEEEYGENGYESEGTAQ